MSPQELRAKYMIALGRIGSERASEAADRHRPIFQRGGQIAEQEAVEEAAKALTVLWNVRRSSKA